MIFESTNLHNFEQPACTGLMASNGHFKRRGDSVQACQRPVSRLQTAEGLPHLPH